MTSEHLHGVLDHKKLVARYLNCVASTIFERVVVFGDAIPFLFEADDYTTLMDMLDVACKIKRDGYGKFVPDAQMGNILRNTIEGYLAHCRGETVCSWMGYILQDIFRRVVEHDYSKFDPEEFDAFERMTPILKTLTYGTPEYKAALKELGPALDHHYQVNPHHPEYYPDGINGMNLIDVIEMVCDWMAAVKRVKDGDIFKSLEINRDRFKIGEQLSRVIRNTVLYLLEQEQQA